MSRQDLSLHRFTGSQGHRRINCAEAIATTYHQHSAPLTQEELKSFRKCGHGKAPGKVCGAYYAASSLLKMSRPGLREDFDRYFTAQAGSVVCREIRRGKRLTCQGCVAVTARYLSQTFPRAV